MKGRLFQLLDNNGDQAGLIYTENKFISSEEIEKWWKEYFGSDPYDEDGTDGFIDFFIIQTGREIERVYIEEEIYP